MSEEQEAPLRHTDFFHLDGAAYETAHDKWNQQRLAPFKTESAVMENQDEQESEFMRQIRTLQQCAPEDRRYQLARYELLLYVATAPGFKRVRLCYGWPLDEVTEVARRFEADGLRVRLHEANTYYYLKVTVPQLVTSK